MIIYRVENSQREGPYLLDRSETYSKFRMDMIDRHSKDKNHPKPEDDGIKKSAWSCFVYGFKDMDQLLAWFTPEDLAGLKEEGFFIVEIDVRDPLDFQFQLGGHQVVMDYRVYQRSKKTVYSWS